jgi:hypothetical protein
MNTSNFINQDKNMTKLSNPFRPGAGHAPPYLAGRVAEMQEFKKLLQQTTILSNLVLTGLRGVGKTVLLDHLKPMAIGEKWLWVGTDLSESASVNEEAIVRRLLADLSPVTAGITIREAKAPKGLSSVPDEQNKVLSYQNLVQIYENQPGLPSDKLKAILEFTWKCLSSFGVKGVIFAYDEAQTMADHSKEKQFPLSLLLDVFQSIQKKAIPFMLVMVGLPTLYPKLVEARTFSERMFDVVTLGRLNPEDSKKAILKPIEEAQCAVKFAPQTVNLIVETSEGYPYFIQFICKELYDVFLQQIEVEGKAQAVPIEVILKKLDKDFFSGRWARATDRQRDLLVTIAKLSNCDEEFSVQDITAESKKSDKPFTPSHINQMLGTLIDAGLIYKNRYGRYAFAVPLLGQFIRRQEKEEKEWTQTVLKFPKG